MNNMNLEKLYKNYGRMLMDISYKITQNKADAEEILQETFIEYWNRKPEGAIIAWLKRVVVNKSLNLVRDRKKSVMKNEDPPPGPDYVIERKEKVEVVREALRNLKPVESTVIVLKKYHGMSHREISRILGITEGNSRIILYRAMDNLREYLKPYFLRGDKNG